MKRAVAAALIAGICFLAPSPAFARPRHGGDIERHLNEWFGAIGQDLDAAGQSFLRVFWQRPDTD